MKKTAIILAITSAFSVNAMAEGVTGGVELDAKFVEGQPDYTSTDRKSVGRGRG